MSDKAVKLVVKGLELDNLIDDSLNNIQKYFKIDSNEIYEDYKIYKPSIMYSASLYDFFSIHFSLIAKNNDFCFSIYSDYKDQADTNIYGFIDYVVNKWHMGTRDITSYENVYVMQLLNKRLQKLNGRLQ
tara:strand:- start:150 stop:539 length:390 start_codon:yes stop_codon:yes gene_type:complete